MDIDTAPLTMHFQRLVLDVPSFLTLSFFAEIAESSFILFNMYPQVGQCNRVVLKESRERKTILLITVFPATNPIELRPSESDSVAKKRLKYQNQLFKQRNKKE